MGRSINVKMLVFLSLLPVWYEVSFMSHLQWTHSATATQVQTNRMDVCSSVVFMRL